jgi:hypothetical protein
VCDRKWGRIVTGVEQGVGWKARSHLREDFDSDQLIVECLCTAVEDERSLIHRKKATDSTFRQLCSAHFQAEEHMAD